MCSYLTKDILTRPLLLCFLVIFVIYMTSQDNMRVSYAHLGNPSASENAFLLLPSTIYLIMLQYP